MPSRKNTKVTRREPVSMIVSFVWSHRPYGCHDLKQAFACAMVNYPDQAAAIKKHLIKNNIIL